jgi:hypothetical protein
VGVGNLSPTANYLSDHAFVEFVTIVLTITCVSTGNALEHFAGALIMKSMSNGGAELAYRLTQMMFPLFVGVGVVSGSALALPFVVLGLYKCGFPETLMHISAAKSPDSPPMVRLSNLLNGVATFVHHTAASLYICGLVTGSAPLNRQVMCVALPLIFQHMWPVMKYYDIMSYAIIQAMFEVWFECEAFSHLEYFGSISVTYRILVYAMLIAHWMYWTAALIELHPDVVEHEIENPPPSAMVTPRLARTPRSHRQRRSNGPEIAMPPFIDSAPGSSSRRRQSKPALSRRRSSIEGEIGKMARTFSTLSDIGRTVP